MLRIGSQLRGKINPNLYCVVLGVELSETAVILTEYRSWRNYPAKEIVTTLMSWAAFKRRREVLSY